MKLSITKPDNIGALTSTLCMIHCVVTPLLFIAQSNLLSASAKAPLWWSNLDYFFLTISFFAIYRSTQTTSSKWIATSLWIAWSVMFLSITNEKIELLHLGESITFISGSLLAALHIYNLSYCQCKSDNCCSKNE